MIILGLFNLELNNKITLMDVHRIHIKISTILQIVSANNISSQTIM